VGKSFRQVRVAYRPARARYRTRAYASAVRPLLSVVAVAGLSVWGFFAARNLWGRLGWARVRQVVVAPLGSDMAPPEGFERAVGIRPGDSLFGFSADGTAVRLHEQFPELAQVRVHRALSGDVDVFYRRRQAQAKVWKDGEWMGMDGTGDLFPLRVFAPEDAPPEDKGRPMPILAGVPAGAAARPVLAFVGILQRLPQTWARGFYKIKLAPSGDALLFIKDGPLVRWGDAAPDEPRVLAKAERLERVLHDPRLAAGAESVRFVDDRRLAARPKSAVDDAKEDAPEKPRARKKKSPPADAKEN
jgi:hypothetical protein